MIGKYIFLFILLVKNQCEIWELFLQLNILCAQNLLLFYCKDINKLLLHFSNRFILGLIIEISSKKYWNILEVSFKIVIYIFYLIHSLFSVLIHCFQMNFRENKSLMIINKILVSRKFLFCKSTDYKEGPRA